MWVQNSPLTQNKEEGVQVARRRPTKHYFNSTSFNLRIKHIFPNLGLGNFLKLKRRRVGEDEEELTNGFSLILEQEFGVCNGIRACNFYFLFPSTISVFAWEMKWNGDEWREGAKLEG